MKTSSSQTGTPRSSDRPIVDTTDLLSRIWQQNLPLMRERVACLERAGLQAAEGPLEAAVRTEASDLTHKLAGSLGMFGYPQGTEIAREMETLLETQSPLDGKRFFQLTKDLHASLPL